MDTMKDTKMQPAKDAVINKLRNRLEAAERRAEMLHRLLNAKQRDHAVIQGQNSALRAKIEQMEQQEPVAWMLNCPTLGGDTGWILSWTQSGAGLCNRLQGEENERKLYALPGAKGEEK